MSEAIAENNAWYSYIDNVLNMILIICSEILLMRESMEPIKKTMKGLSLKLQQVSSGR